LDKEEETFIITWIENRDPNSPINWGELIDEIQQRFNKLRPKNKIKNFWYSRIRRQGIANRMNRINRINREYDSINNTLYSTVTSRFNSNPIPHRLNSRNPLTYFSSNHFSIPIIYANHNNQIPPQYPLQLTSIPITPQFNHNQIRTNPIVLHHTLQPNPDPPKFNEPYNMNPI
jgi:hypothetical protein